MDKMALAFAPQRVRSFPKGSMSQTYDVDSKLLEALNMQANMQAQLSRFNNIGNQPPHLQATMLSEKLRI